MLHILSYSAKEGLREPSASELPALLADTGRGRVVWVDLENPNASETALLSDVFRFHPLAIEDCLSFVPNPKIDDYNDYLYIVLHGINAEALKKNKLETHDLDIFLGPNYLVTFHKGFFRSVANVMERCRKNPSIMGKDPESLMHKIIDGLVDNYLPIMDELEDKIDVAEKEIFKRPREATPKRLLELKKDVLYLRRVTHPQREVLRQLSNGEYAQICTECRFHFKDVYDHIFMVSELIESYRDAISGAMEVYLSMVSNRLNEVMKVLTVIATIMMPLTVITGVYGMNFQRMPMLDSPYGFSMVIGLMGAVSVGMLFYFRKKGWF